MALAHLHPEIVYDDPQWAGRLAAGRCLSWRPMGPGSRLSRARRVRLSSATSRPSSSVDDDIVRAQVVFGLRHRASGYIIEGSRRIRDSRCADGLIAAIDLYEDALRVEAFMRHGPRERAVGRRVRPVRAAEHRSPEVRRRRVIVCATPYPGRADRRQVRSLLKEDASGGVRSGAATPPFRRAHASACCLAASVRCVREPDPTGQAAGRKRAATGRRSPHFGRLRWPLVAASDLAIRPAVVGVGWAGAVPTARASRAAGPATRAVPGAPPRDTSAFRFFTYSSGRRPRGEIADRRGSPAARVGCGRQRDRGEKSKNYLHRIKRREPYRSAIRSVPPWTAMA